MECPMSLNIFFLPGMVGRVNFYPLSKHSMGFACYLQFSRQGDWSFVQSLIILEAFVQKLRCSKYYLLLSPNMDIKILCQYSGSMSNLLFIRHKNNVLNKNSISRRKQNVNFNEKSNRNHHDWR